MITALNQPEGDFGKTTLAINLVSTISTRGNKVLLIDADPQGSVQDWTASHTAEPIFAVMGLPRANLHKELLLHDTSYDTIIIDGPPRVNEVARSVIMAACLFSFPWRWPKPSSSVPYFNRRDTIRPPLGFVW